MRFAFVALLTAFSSAIPKSLAYTWGFPYESQKVRGVNLGGWLVLEPWITPSLFDNTGDSRIIDEYTFSQYQNRDVALNALRQHWETWITEADFQSIAAAGLNHVRLPIGYWAFEVSNGEPYIQGQIEYMNRALVWAQKYNIKVIIDLHGAPGSQNGFDNSGQKMDYPTWHTQQSNVNRTNEVIKQIANRFKDSTGIVPAIAALNEPAGFFGQDVIQVTKQFWLDSYNNIRYPYSEDTTRTSNTVLIIHDAFQPTSSWNDFMPYPTYEGVILDTHIYQVFSPNQVAWSEEQHIQAVCNRAGDMTASGMWTVVGEWCPARTDCAKYLNGRGVGNRYEGTYPGSTRVGSCAGFTGKASTFSTSYKAFLRRFWEAQTITYEKGSGWIQWTWKAEEADDWAYQAGLENGWIPWNPTERLHAGICG
ncbi:exo-beta-1,3-glucanase [Coprinopsis marcescibilis]|uniref:glucan 1,3-beta-glucosidase n=1 Tax=Coprinopsis marcescibilis TaxID=230819 RepID=A0A5C3KIA3_COPMA|nr:exo-beta-1,3-glucanase [Coprinopsis marcescibilis]